MKKVSLEYCKFILEKVSFDEKLFEKELHKAIKMLVDNDLRELIDWVKSKYKHYKVVSKLKQVFV